MSKENFKAAFAIPLILLIAAGIAWAGSQGGAVLEGGLPLFALAVVLSFLINWLVFIPSYLYQTEKFFDITGTITYVTLTVTSLLLAPQPDLRTYLVAALVIVWTLRLGTFLFRRIHKAGKDGRFDDLKPSFFRFLTVWTLQGLWVVFTMAAALVVITSSTSVDFGIFGIVGLLVWLFGFAFEVVADAQKSRFRADPANKGKFIRTGLWSKSRHPNYFGEIVLWVGVAIIALPVLRGWQWVALISPVFVTILLTKISGVPLLEKSADERWGGQEDYEEYKKNTPVLIPKL
jgi:steroid 5-alpha reductase family enzyme